MLRNGKRLEHFEVPESFLKLPLVENITEEPNQSYNLPVSGQIHGSKLRQILDKFKTLDRENWKEEIGELVRGNLLEEKIVNLTFSQFLDYLIHLAYANREINWNSISILQQYFADEFDHISRWKLPSFDFENDLLAFNSTRFHFKPDHMIQRKTKEIKNILLKNYKKEEAEQILPNSILNILSSDYINFSVFFQLLGRLRIIQMTGLIKYDEFAEIISSLSQTSLKLYQSHQFESPEKRILYITHFISTFISDDPKSIEQCQRMLDVATLQLNNLSSQKKRSYMWLIDACKAMIVNEVTKFKMEMVTEDLLIRSIGERFLNPENTDLKTWIHTIETTELPVEIVIILIQGYVAVEEILRRYNAQLPDTDLENMSQINNFLINLLMIFENSYEHRKDGLTGFSKFATEFYLTRAWAKIYLNQLIMFPSNNNTLRSILKERIDSSIFESFFQLTVICGQILSDEYPFEDHIKEIIVSDEDDFLNLIGNEQFAKVFVDKFATSFNHAQQIQINGGGNPIQIYEELIYFLLSWMPNLLTIEEIIQDTIIMFLSFFKVLINMVETYYSEKGELKAARLWDLNYKLFELNLYSIYGYPKLNNINQMLSMENIFDDFLNLLKEFDLNKNINTIDKRYLVLDSIYDMSNFKFHSRDNQVNPEKLSSDNIMQYLDLRNDLDQFLQELGQKSMDEIHQLFETDKFPPRDQPLTLLDKIDFSALEVPLKFPYIKSVEMYTAAIRFFDLEIEVELFND